jgi:pyruvate/2-oxoglutarate dehydrogenase complex dihydrolipoamide acyltransferase (E2) component
MEKHGSHRVVPFSANRRLVAATLSVNSESHTIHTLTEVDVTRPRELLRQHRQRTGESLSLTAYVVTCLARALEQQPELNSFRRGRKLVVLDDVTVNTLVERDVGAERVPEPCPIHAVQQKTYRQVHDELRAAQRHQSGHLGTLSESPWFLLLLPERLARTFVRLATRSTTMAKKYGVVAVTAVGMFGSGACWGVPLTAATVTVTVGGIARRPVVEDGALEEREHLCLTISFDHDIVDGAPAARFVTRLTEILQDGSIAREATALAPADG